MSLDGSHVVVGLSGGIACYKACEVVRLLAAALVRTSRSIMTAGAQQFVAPLTLADAVRASGGDRHLQPHAGVGDRTHPAWPTMPR